MKGNSKKFLLLPLFFVASLTTLFLFQNCTEDVSFGEGASADRPDLQLDDTSPVGPNGQPVGGNTDIVISVTEQPQDGLLNQGDTGVAFDVNSPIGAITGVDCVLNGQAVACQPGTRVVIPNTTLGPNTLVINAQDDKGQTATRTLTWTIFQQLVQLTTDFTVNVVGDQVDIIINVDNSGSMEYEQTSMASRISSFMQPFANLDYHIAVTTTSPIGNSVIWAPELDYVDGKFVELGNGNHCIKKNEQTLAEAQTLIQNNVVRDLYLRDANGDPVINPFNQRPFAEGNGWERGIFTTYRAFERSTAANSPEADCLRDNVAKHVILISDERETLTDERGGPLNDQAKSVGANLVNYVGQLYGASTIFRFHSIIVNPETPEGEACLQSYGARPGVEYFALSQLTGGFVGSVCAADYSTQLSQIGQSISDSQKAYNLSCVAVPNAQGQMGTVVNLGNNMPVGTTFEFKGNTVEFDQLLGQGNYRVTYYCYQ